MPQTPHQRAEAELTAYGLTFPETSAGPGWTVTRALYVRKKMFAVFGEKGEPRDALTLIMKLPISAEMAEELAFVRPAKGWYKQHNWVTAHFEPDDDILAEMATLKGWLKQSYVAVAPKALGRVLG
ncbi:MmcQ/YjbR family DNA-binding protein [Vitreimonas sp.]|uniref:MmcQ/YjbR family DNA-binding protein n=1 Tax=Vitreimonas sp. TaxID=3069702 RepID=UPI002ED97033